MGSSNRDMMFGQLAQFAFGSDRIFLVLNCVVNISTEGEGV